MINEDEQFERERLKDFSKPVRRKLKTSWSFEAAQDLKSFSNIDIKL
jgi:hypothetical protein